MTLPGKYSPADAADAADVDDNMMNRDPLQSPHDRLQ